jgi:hypothetical protein
MIKNIHRIFKLAETIIGRALRQKEEKQRR